MPLRELGDEWVEVVFALTETDDPRVTHHVKVAMSKTLSALARNPQLALRSGDALPRTLALLSPDHEV